MTDDAVITLHPLHIGADENGEREVGRVDTGMFVALPAEGVALLEWLSTGLTMSEAQARFAERYGSTPDLADFLAGIGECGFIAAVNGVPYDSAGQPAPEPVRGVTLLGGVRQEWVAWLLTPPMRLLYWAVWLTVAVLLLSHTELLPRGSDALVFDRVLPSAIFLGVVGWVLVLLHECAHAIAARAIGCTGRLSVSRRLYFLVAQTDVSGVRTVPRNRRYAVFLAGMTWDLSIVVCCLAAELAGATGTGQRLARAGVYLLLVALIFQFLVFMRTDVYYALANWLRLGNLMENTRHLLSNRTRRMLRRAPRHDLGAVPARELRIVRWYAPFYLLGSAAAIAVFALLAVPAFVPMVEIAVRGITGAAGPAGFWDGTGFIALIATQFVTLGWVWIHERRLSTRGLR